MSPPCLQAPAIPVVRRHSRGEGQFHFAPAVQVRQGNSCAFLPRCMQQSNCVPALPGLAGWPCESAIITLQVVSGNYVTAKRRGVVNGIDFGACDRPV